MYLSKMNCSGSVPASSPTYRNLKHRHNQSPISPIELKTKMRKSYKDKVQNCRHMLLDRLRGTSEADVRDTLTEIYRSMFNFSEKQELESEESDVLEEIQKELIQEELEWWAQEYEKSQIDNVDWSALEQDSNVICPICQKDNFSLGNGLLSCPRCKYNITTNKALSDINMCLHSAIEKHSVACKGDDIQFTIISDNNETHIYLICQNCSEMCLLV